MLCAVRFDCVKLNFFRIFSVVPGGDNSLAHVLLMCAELRKLRLTI